MHSPISNNTPTSQQTEEFQVKLTGVTSRDSTTNLSKHVSVENYDVSLQTVAGEILASTQIALERRTGTQDVADVFAWYEDENGILYVAVIKSFRPVMKLSDSECAPWTNSQPGSYIETSNGSSSASLDKTTKTILDEKLGLKAKDGAKAQILGGSFLPNIKVSPEVVTQLAIEVDPKSLTEPAAGKSLFTIGRDVQFMPAQKVLDEYFAGNFQDPRLVSAILKFAQQEDHDLRVPPINSRQIPISSEFIHPKIESVSRAKEVLLQAPKFNGQTAKLVITEAKNKGSEFLKLKQAEVTIEDNNPAIKQSHKLKFEAVVPEKDHNVHCLCYTRDSNGKIYLLVNHGVRPAIEIRETTPHPLGIKPDHWSIEGLSFSIDSTERSNLPELLKTEFKKQGISYDPDQAKLVTSNELPSPGFNPTSSSRLLIPVNAADVWLSPPPFSSGHYWLELKTAQELSRNGKIKDLQLDLSISILANALGEPQTNSLPWSKEEREALSKIACSGSQLLELIQHAQETASMHRILYCEPIYRKLLIYAEQFLGVVPKRFKHHEEKIFFDAAIAIFALPEKLDNSSFLIQLLHDIKHYAMGTFMPYDIKNGDLVRDDQGQPILRSKADYRQAYLENEAQAGFFSHYKLPKILGLDQNQEIVLGFQPLSKVFAELGINDQDKAFAAFLKIALERTIPKEILEHPNYFSAAGEKNRAALLQLLKLGKVFDMHIEELYPLWLKSPEVAKHYLRFSELQSKDLQDYRNNFEESLTNALESPEGINPFKSEIAKFINSEIRVPALRLAFVKQELLELTAQTSATPEQAKLIRRLDQQLEETYQDYKKFITAREKISTLDYNTDNRQALRLLTRFESTTKRQINALYEEAIKQLPVAVQEKIAGRELPFFPRLEFGNNPEIMDYALEREAVSQAAAGLI